MGGEKARKWQPFIREKKNHTPKNHENREQATIPAYKPASTEQRTEVDIGVPVWSPALPNGGMG